MWWDFLLESDLRLLGAPQAGCEIWKLIATGTLALLEGGTKEIAI